MTDHVNDCKHAILSKITGHIGHINDLELEWLQIYGGAISNHINDAWREALFLQGIAFAHINDMWKEYFISIDAPSDNISDNLKWYWCIYLPSLPLTCDSTLFTCDRTDITCDQVTI